jgi:hypothetical protein
MSDLAIYHQHRLAMRVISGSPTIRDVWSAGAWST